MDGMVPALDAGLSMVSLFSPGSAPATAEETGKPDVRRHGEEGMCHDQAGYILHALPANHHLRHDAHQTLYLEETQQEEMVRLYQPSGRSGHVHQRPAVGYVYRLLHVCAAWNTTRRPWWTCRSANPLCDAGFHTLGRAVGVVCPVILTLFIRIHFFRLPECCGFNWWVPPELAMLAGGLLLLAKGKGGRFLFTEVSWYVVYYAATALMWPHFIIGTGMASTCWPTWFIAP